MTLKLDISTTTTTTSWATLKTPEKKKNSREFDEEVQSREKNKKTSQCSKVSAKRLKIPKTQMQTNGYKKNEAYKFKINDEGDIQYTYKSLSKNIET